jgi:tricarballylate dehydrogenase
MLTQYVGARAVEMPLIAPGVASNRGDGLRMAVAVGADTAGQFDMFHGEPVDSRTTHPDGPPAQHGADERDRPAPGDGGHGR